MIRRLYRAILRLHPSGFRERFGEEILSIFDETPGRLIKTKLLADGVVSMLRQGGLRSRFRQEPMQEFSPESVPLFESIGAFRPRSSALGQGAILTLGVFIITCLSINYSLSHTVRLRFPEIRGNDRSPLTASRESSAVLGVAEQQSFEILPVDSQEKNTPTTSSFRGYTRIKPTPRFLTRAEMETIRLPSPSGRYGVARIQYDWVDEQRHESQASNPAAHREIAVYIWYPTKPGLQQVERAEYLPHSHAIAETTNDDIKQQWGDAWPSIFSGEVRIDTYKGAPISVGSERFPLLIFSPGFGTSSTAYTALIEDVVSHGYIVAAIEPTYDVPAVVFNDGRVILFKRQWIPGAESATPGETWQQFLDRIRAFNQSHVLTWASDIRFVIDQLFKVDTYVTETVPFAGRIDLRNIAAWGHSMGGKAATRACELDSRIKACLDADGSAIQEGDAFDSRSNVSGSAFLWIDVYHEPATDAQLAVHGITRRDWQIFYEHRVQAADTRMLQWPGNSYRLTIKNAHTSHDSFTDFPMLEAQTDEDYKQSMQALVPIEEYTVAFFDKYLKHRSNTLLDQRTNSADISLKQYASPR